MSITHSLKFESQHSEKEILNLLLSSNIGLQPAKYDQMKGEGLYGWVSKIEKTFSNDLRDIHRIYVEQSVTFDEDFEGDRDQTLEVLGKAVALLLAQEIGDAMFFWVVDTPILKRTNGQIQVTNEPEFGWLRNALDEAGLSYELQPTQAIRQPTM